MTPRDATPRDATSRLREARAALVAWFDAHRRDLPWRRTRDPYAIWVSEVMLQQTRVETVIPYFERFLARFPTPAALAGAPDDAVLGAWSGLGYYRRARLLQAGARAAVERHGGVVPADATARLELPGIGRYTAGAIGSIAFGREEPLVDGNVARVLSRLLAIDAPLGTRDSERALWAHATTWARGPRPGDANQALMELGAMVCVPVAPRCDTCPVRAQCQAHAEDRVAALPVPKVRRAPVEVSVVAVVAISPDQQVRLVRRGPEGPRLGPGLFQGLWNVPMAEGEGRGDARGLADAHGLALLPTEPTRVRHVLSHRVLDVHVFRATPRSVADSSTNEGISTDASVAHWHRVDASERGISTLTRRILASLDGADIAPNSEASSPQRTRTRKQSH